MDPMQEEAKYQSSSSSPNKEDKTSNGSTASSNTVPTRGVSITSSTSSSSDQCEGVRYQRFCDHCGTCSERGWNMIITWPDGTMTAAKLSPNQPIVFDVKAKRACYKVVKQD